MSRIAHYKNVQCCQFNLKDFQNMLVCNSGRCETSKKQDFTLVSIFHICTEQGDVLLYTYNTYMDILLYTYNTHTHIYIYIYIYIYMLIKTEYTVIIHVFTYSFYIWKESILCLFCLFCKVTFTLHARIISSNSVKEFLIHSIHSKEILQGLVT